MTPVRIVLADLLALTPLARKEYVLSIAHANAVLVCFGVLNNAHRAAHFLAQILHESGGLRIAEENLHYTRASRIQVVWPSRFPTVADAQPYVRNPEALANHVYGNRTALGNTEPGDGWRFRGRGLIQVTGRGGYARVGQALDADFVSHPELVTSEAYALPVAAAVWRAAGCNALADRDDIRAVTKAINGAYTNIDDRIARLARVRQAVVAS